MNLEIFRFNPLESFYRLFHNAPPLCQLLLKGPIINNEERGKITATTAKLSAFNQRKHVQIVENKSKRIQNLSTD